MTQRVSHDHHEDADLELDGYAGCINLRLAKGLEVGASARKTGFRMVAQEFPILLPLSQ